MSSPTAARAPRVSIPAAAAPKSPAKCARRVVIVMALDCILRP
jgi:hypothetical protein